MKKPVIIVKYNPQWPTIYEEEKSGILSAIGDSVLAIEHFGSTSVPGLGAKPIIDIMAGIKDAEIADSCLPMLAKIGYTDITPQPDEIDWFYCLGKGPHSIGYHLHLVRYPSNFWDKHIIFREFLKENPERAQQYFELKKKLAEQYGSNRLGYCKAKGHFIESVIAALDQDEQN